MKYIDRTSLNWRSHIQQNLLQIASQKYKFCILSMSLVLLKSIILICSAILMWLKYSKRPLYHTITLGTRDNASYHTIHFVHSVHSLYSLCSAHSAYYIYSVHPIHSIQNLIRHIIWVLMYKTKCSISYESFVTSTYCCK